MLLVEVKLSTEYSVLSTRVDRVLVLTEGSVAQ